MEYNCNKKELFILTAPLIMEYADKLMFEGVCLHMFCRDRRPRRSESEGYVRTHLEREKRCRSLICSNISHVHGPPRTSVPTRLVRFFIIDYRRKSRCLTEDFRSATNMFAQIVLRESRRRKGCRASATEGAISLRDLPCTVI